MSARLPGSVRGLRCVSRRRTAHTNEMASLPSSARSGKEPSCEDHLSQRNQDRPQPRLLLPLLVAAAVVAVAVILAVIFLTQIDEGSPAVPDTGSPAAAWMKNENGYYFNNAGEPILAATLKGIDVSAYQGEVDWQKAKDAGIDFAILRCGYGSEWNGEGEYGQDDPYWERNADATLR